MPQIIPIRDLKKTSEISSMCQSSKDPVFVTKNGYGDMVIMSMKVYEEKMGMQEIFAKLAEAEEDISTGRTTDAVASLQKLRQQYGL